MGFRARTDVHQAGESLRGISCALGFICIVTFTAPLSASAGLQPEALCKDRKLKATGVKTLDVLKAFGSNAKRPNVGKLTSDVSKAQSRFSKGFTRAEFTATGVPRGCVTTGDAPATQGLVDPLVLDVLSALEIRVGPEFQVNTLTTGDQRSPAVALVGGGFAVVWSSGGYGIRGQRYDSTGTPAGGEFQVTSNGGSPAVAPAGAGGFVVVWVNASGDGSYASIQALRYDSTGAPMGGQFQVNTYTTGQQTGPAVGPTGTGGFVVAWSSNGSSGTDTDSTSVQGQRYDSLGSPVGGEFQVNTHTTNNQEEPAVSPAGSGGFVVVWQSSGGDTSNHSVQGQRYDSAGAPVGAEFQVNTYTTGWQWHPSVAPVGTDGFVVVWDSSGSSGSDTSLRSVQGQRYDGAGAPVGSEFQVNTYTPNFQERPAVGPDGAGGFVVVWNSVGTTFSSRGQRYDSTGTRIGGEFPVNPNATSFQIFPAVAPDGAGGFVVVWEGTDTSLFGIRGQRFRDPYAVVIPTTSAFGSLMLGALLGLLMGGTRRRRITAG